MPGKQEEADEEERMLQKAQHMIMAALDAQGMNKQARQSHPV